MEELKAFESMGLVLPSAWYVLGAILFGIVGYLVYSRGRKMKQAVLIWTGVALMLYPYAVSETWVLWAAGLGLSALAFAKWESG